MNPSDSEYDSDNVSNSSSVPATKKPAKRPAFLGEEDDELSVASGEDLEDDPDADPDAVDSENDDEEDDEEDDEDADKEQDDDDDDEINEEELPFPKIPTTKPQKKKSKRAKQLQAQEDDENDESFLYNDDDEDLIEDKDEYYQKVKNHVERSRIFEDHPELRKVNHEEIEALCQIVRDAKGRIIDPLHTTLPFLTKYEKADILGKRAAQINEGAQLFTEVDPSIIDGSLIALKEFEEKKIPFIVQRPLPNGAMEYWRLQDLEYL